MRGFVGLRGYIDVRCLVNQDGGGERSDDETLVGAKIL